MRKALRKRREVICVVKRRRGGMRSIEQIVREQKRARITNRELCETAKVHHQTYRRIRRGDNSPTMRTVRKLDEALAALVSS